MTKCQTKYCRNKARPRGKVCPACYAKKWRACNPIKAAYLLLKSNAKRRHKPFNLSLEYFTKFCYETDYHIGKGKSKTSLTVDCKINELGYVEGNIQALPNTDNARKGCKRLEYDWRTREAFVRTERVYEIEDLPF